MSQKYFTILTKLGAELLANATALGVPLKLTSMAVGDGNGSIPNPTATQTALIHEVRRAAINSLSVDKNNHNQIIAEQVIPENEGGWFIHEIGLFDDQGRLIAVGNCPSTYKPKLSEGSGRTQIIRMIIIIDNIDSVELKIDPSVVLATRSYVDELITEKINNHELSINHPLATTQTAGIVQLSSEIDSNDETRAATSLAIKRVHDSIGCLTADDICALPAIKPSNDNDAYQVTATTEFKHRPVFNGAGLITTSDYTYEINGNTTILRRADGLIIQRFTAQYHAVHGVNGTVVTLPISFPSEFYIALSSDGAAGCHTTNALPHSNSTVKVWGKVADEFHDSFVQIIAIGR